MLNFLIHLLSYLSLGAYVVGSFNSSYYIGKRIISSALVLGLLSQILILLLVLHSNLVLGENYVRLAVNSSWMIMFCSMLILFTYIITEEGSPYHTRLFYYFSLILLILSLIGFHFSTPGTPYELSPFLAFHIVVSILSQVSVYFVFCLSLLVFLLNKLLKNKTKITKRLPSLVPTQKLLYSSEYMSIGLLSSSIVSGFFILNMKFDGLYVKFVFSFLFLFLLVVSTFARKVFKVSSINLNYYSLLCWAFLLSFQALYKLGIKF